MARSQIASNAAEAAQVRVLNAQAQYWEKELFNRERMFNRIWDGEGRNINKECGYKEYLDAYDYRAMYDREGIAQRVVNILSDESWRLQPLIYEVEDDIETPFEQAWKLLNRRLNLMQYLQRVDRLSGIGHYGILLLGVDDGAERLSDPVDGMVDPVATLRAQRQGKTAPVAKAQNGLLFVRALDESMAQVAEFDNDMSSPRFSLPKYYNIRLMSWTEDAVVTAIGVNTTSYKVHWSRVYHVADNCESSVVYGIPRQKPVYNYLHNIRKILGGSGEMFWKGGFPGYSFTANPDIQEMDIDPKEMRKEFERYSNGLQRYLALVGVEAKSLAPQVADPTASLTVQLQAICITLGIPMRVFMGSEQAKLASSQDAHAWNGRLKKRQEEYMTPFMIRPFIHHLINIGVLPPLENSKTDEGTETMGAELEEPMALVHWPDLDSPTEDDKASVALKWAQTLQAYTAGDGAVMCPAKSFYTVFCGLPDEVAQGIVEEAAQHIADTEELEADQTDADGSGTGGTGGGSNPPQQQQGTQALDKTKGMPPAGGPPVPAKPSKTPPVLPAGAGGKKAVSKSRKKPLQNTAA